jgi:predicted nucleic acid-binding protein
MVFLLDTNVISEVRKPNPDPGVDGWFAGVDPDGLFLSVLVVGELRQGVERLARRDPAQAAPLELWLEELLSSFADRLVPISARIADRWGRLNVPNPLPVIDGLLAATALEHDWIFVTRNEADVVSTGARLLNPWSLSGR